MDPYSLSNRTLCLGLEPRWLHLEALTCTWGCWAVRGLSWAELQVSGRTWQGEDYNHPSDSERPLNVVVTSTLYLHCLTEGMKNCCPHVTHNWASEGLGHLPVVTQGSRACPLCYGFLALIKHANFLGNSTEDQQGVNLLSRPPNKHLRCWTRWSWDCSLSLRQVSKKANV